MSASSSERDLPAARHAGERIHLIMWKQKIKQSDLGAAVGIGQSTLSKKLRGDVPITVDELMGIAEVLGVDPGDLLPRLDSNQQPSGYPSAQVSGVADLEEWRRRQAHDTPPPGLLLRVR